MNKEEYVSFECAKKLLEARMEIRRCDYIYALKPFEYRRTWWFAGFPTAKAEVGELFYHRSLDPETIISITRDDYVEAPSLYHVQKYFRTRGIEVVASFSYSKKIWGYQVGNMRLSEDSILAQDYSFPTYEAALQAGIMKALNLFCDDMDEQNSTELS